MGKVIIIIISIAYCLKALGHHTGIHFGYNTRKLFSADEEPDLYRTYGKGQFTDTEELRKINKYTVNNK